MLESGPDLARRTLGAVRRQSGSSRRAPRSDGPGDRPRGQSGGADAVVVPSDPDAGSASPSPPVAAGAVATLPSRDELVQVWGDGLLAQLPNRARARFRVGRFLAVDGSEAVFALPNETHRSYCEEVRLDVEAALASRFGTPVPIRLVVDVEDLDEPGPPRPARLPPEATPAVTPAGPRTGGSPRPAAPAPAPAPQSAALGNDDAPDLLDPAVLAAETEPAGAGLSPEERLKQAFPGAQEV